MNKEVYLPDYYRLFERITKGWLLKPAQFFYKRFPGLNIDYNDFELLYGISKQQVIIEMFRINGGKSGYYLADLRRNKKYYYCGTEPEDVKRQLQALKIGRADPMEN